MIEETATWGKDDKDARSTREVYIPDDGGSSNYYT
jgi:hypothetical protein